MYAQSIVEFHGKFSLTDLNIGLSVQLTFSQGS